MNVTIKATVYSVVIVRAKSPADAIAQVGPYLYGHTGVSSDTFQVREDRVILLLHTSTVTNVEWRPSGSVIDSIGDVQRLAETQCERLRSGLFAAEVIGDKNEATEKAIDLA